MKTDKNFIIQFILWITFITILIIYLTKYNNYKDKVVSLPEEIQLVKIGNTLIVEQITKDSIIIGFKQKEKIFYNGK